MHLFFKLFNPGIPICLLIIILSFALMLSCITIYVKDGKKIDHILQIWIIAYLLIMLYSTVIGRFAQEDISIHLTPLWSISAIQKGLIETFYEKLFNVLFFIPYGMLLGMFYSLCSRSFWSNKFPTFSRVIWKSFVFGVITSVCIEILQLITRTGTCETDDVICNTLGCVLGAMIAVGMIKLYKRFKNTD